MSCALPIPLIAQPVLLEAPLVLHAPGYRGIWPAWYDGEVFWTQPEPLMKLLGYEVHVSDSTELAVRDQRHAIRFAFTEELIEVNRDVRHTGGFALVGSDGQMLITLEALQATLGTDAEWDEATLTLTLSSSAELFDPTRFGNRRTLDVEVPSNILFPRERVWLGGVHVGYSLTHQWRQERGRSIQPTARVTAAVAGGTLRWNLSTTGSHLRYEFPMQYAWITRIEATHHPRERFPGLRFSNRPLHPRSVQREEVLSGTTIPHAIVRGKVFGAVTEQVQADRGGRFTIRHPVFYGSTEASVEVEPLGGDPVDILALHRITPHEILPPGKIEYEASISKAPAATFSWGVSDALTLGAAASHTPRTARLHAALQPLPTAYMTVTADVLGGAGRARLRWWRPWGGVSGDYQRQQTPLRMDHWSSTLNVASDTRRLHVRFLHQSTPSAPSRTEIQSTLGWQWGQALMLWSGVRFRSGMSDPWGLQPMVAYTLPFTTPRTILRVSAESAGARPAVYQAGAYVSGSAWSSGIQARRSVQSGAVELRVHLQLNTQWAWLDARAGWDERGFSHSQTLRGTVMVGEDIRLGALFTERTQAVIRLFVDSNLNGRLDGGESLYLRHRLDVGHLAVQHRANGEVVAPNLIPHEIYRVKIEQASITDPLLHPATGYEFAFQATPGRTRYINVPLQMLPTVAGQLTGWPGSYSALQVQIQTLSTSSPTMVEVYQDGVFFVQLPPGSWQATVIDVLSGDVVGAATMDVVLGENFPLISLQP